MKKKMRNNGKGRRKMKNVRGKWNEKPDFFFLLFHFSGTIETLFLGLPKWKFLPGKD